MADKAYLANKADKEDRMDNADQAGTSKWVFGAGATDKLRTSFGESKVGKADSVNVKADRDSYPLEVHAD